MNRTDIRNRNFILIVIGQIISLFGNAILRFALPMYILDISGSPSLFGFVAASAVLPMVLFSPVGGILADRMHKQRIMVALDFLTAALVIGYLLLQNIMPVVPLVVIVLMVLSSIQGTYAPAVQASVPLLIKEDSLVHANAIINLVQSFSALIGPAIGGKLYTSFGLTPIMVAALLCFLFSAVMELFIRIPYTKPGPTNKGGIVDLIKCDMKSSIAFIVKENPVLIKTILIVFLFNVFLTPMLVVGLPVVITKNLGLDISYCGMLQSAIAGGGLVGGALIGVLGRHSKMAISNSYLVLLLCSLGLLPVGLILLSSAAPLTCYVVLTVFSFLAMIFASVFNIQILTFVQSQTPPQLIGKVIACMIAFCMAAQPLGQALYGILFDVFANSAAIIIVGCVAISSTISIYSKKVFALYRESSVPA